jgi:hypothetical protein
MKAQFFGQMLRVDWATCSSHQVEHALALLTGVAPLEVFGMSV